MNSSRVDQAARAANRQWLPLATNRSSGSLAGANSIDQFIANGLNNPATVTALASLNLAVPSESGSNSFHAHSQVMFQLIQVALACDLRFARSVLFDSVVAGCSTCR